MTAPEAPKGGAQRALPLHDHDHELKLIGTNTATLPRLGDVSDGPGAAPGIPAVELEQTLPDEQPPAEQPQPATLPVAIAAALTAAGGGWLVAGAFAGVEARLVALGAALFGGLLVALSYLSRRPAVLQVLSLVLVLAAAAGVAAPGLGGGADSLPSQVADAIRQGGLTDPPVAFDPGWRFLLVVLVSSVAITAATLALWLRRTQLAVLVGVPLVIAGVLIQPPGSHALTVAIALAFVVAGLSVAYGGQLAGQGSTGARFEVRRLLTALVVGGLVVGAQFGLGRIGSLLPTTQQDHTIPPRVPQQAPSTSNEVLFNATAPADVPLRMGVLDVYSGGSWLTPPYDPATLVPVTDAGTLPSASTAAPAAGADLSVTITTGHLDGRALPELAGATQVTGYSGGLGFDPRTQTLTTSGRISSGTTYTVKAAPLPTGADLGKVSDTAIPADLRQFTSAPPPPYAVQDLLLKMPAGLTPYGKLAYLRSAYYAKAVAAGAGNPVPVPAQEVANILAGRPASPYQIVAAEVLLARWAGIPARLGYGYYGGSVDSGKRDYRAKDGAMWLEAYFSGYGWVPILGTPTHAQASLTTDPKNSQQIKATDELGASVYVPIQVADAFTVRDIIRYWVVRMLPWILGLLALAFFFPGLTKLGRRYRRRWWGRRHGPQAIVMVEYAELRDYANDLNVGHPSQTPIEFLDSVTPDDDHTDLAWLVSRALWGDLTRDLRPEDAANATRMARSVRRRLFAGAPILMRILAFVSRASLREPYAEVVPNLWFRTRAVLLRLSLTIGAAAAAGALLAGLVLTGGVQQVDLTTTAAERTAVTAELPSAPSSLGDVNFAREESAETAFTAHSTNALVADGRFYTATVAGQVEATLQIGAVKPSLLGRGEAVRTGMLSQLGTGAFTVSHLNGEQLYVQHLAEVNLLVWFAPGDAYYELVTAKNGYDTADRMLVSLLDYQRTGSTSAVDAFTGTPPLDARRGGS